jgi:lipopolysaccharide/colanic/teichoic acid biosynthesis glycosyltransferase
MVIGQTLSSILLIEEASRRGLHIEVVPYSIRRNELMYAGGGDRSFHSDIADIIVVDEPCSEMIITDAPKYLLLGIPVISYQSFFEKLFGKVAPETITNRWALDLRVDFRDRLCFKRALDLLLAVLFLILLFPFFPLIAIAIWLCDKGPVFYIQARVGQGGEIFNIYKFRTMRMDAEPFGPRWASGLTDPRVIKCGNFLRRTRLDEIPQLLNIIRGEMSFVGPRPERPEFVEYLKRRLSCYELRHIVKPGLTGYAQIRYHYGASERDALEKLRYDLYYIKNRNFLVDLYIIIFTVTAIIRGIILGR